MALVKHADWQCDFCKGLFSGDERKVCYLDWCGKCELEDFSPSPTETLYNLGLIEPLS